MNDPEIESVVPLYSREGSVITGLLQARGPDFDDPPERAVFRIDLRFSGRMIDATSTDDFFDALLTLRSRLEAEGLLLGCYGCSRNVYPSPMDRDSSSARAYRMTLGRPALEADRVGLFETGNDVQPATIAEQEAYRRDWFASLRAADPSRRGSGTS